MMYLTFSASEILNSVDAGHFASATATLISKTNAFPRRLSRTRKLSSSTSVKKCGFREDAPSRHLEHRLPPPHSDAALPHRADVNVPQRRDAAAG
jgi:hypothetical protein